MIRRLLLSACALITWGCTGSYAQAVTDTTSYHIDESATGFVNRAKDGNAYLVNNNLLFSVLRRNISLNAASSWVYGEQETGLTNNDISASIDANLFKTVSKFYYWGLVTYDKSYSLKINNRGQAGMGIGYTLIDRDDASLVLSDGPLYETSKLYDTSEYQTVRNSLRIKYRFVIGKRLVLDGTNFLQNSLLSEQDYIIKANNNLSFKLNNWLSLTIATAYNKLNQTHSETLLCNFGFRVERTF